LKRKKGAKGKTYQQRNISKKKGDLVGGRGVTRGFELKRVCVKKKVSRVSERPDPAADQGGEPVRTMIREQTRT